MNAKNKLLIVPVLVLSACQLYYEEKPLETTETLKPSFVSIKKNIIDRRCLSCHSSGGNAGSVRLTSREEILNSPRELVLLGNAEESGLMIAITRNDDKRMPPSNQGNPLSNEEIEIIRKWIKNGAPE